MPPRTPKEIPESFRRDMRDLLHRHVLTINRVMDLYRDEAQVSYRDLEHLARQIGDPDLAIGHSVWQTTITGRGGVIRPPGPEVLTAFIYLLGLDLHDLNLNSANHPMIAGALDWLRKGRAAA